MQLVAVATICSACQLAYTLPYLDKRPRGTGALLCSVIVLSIARKRILKSENSYLATTVPFVALARASTASDLVLRDTNMSGH